MIRVLCIEDDDAMARLVQRRLERSGYTCTLAANGELGLELVQRGSFDIVIADYWMPGVSGMEVLSELSHHIDPPPVIMLTGLDDLEVAVSAMRLGAADFLSKDTQGRYLDLLPAVIERVISRRRLEGEREAARALAQVTLSSICDAVITTDANGCVNYLNPVAEQLTGWPKDEARGRQAAEIFRTIHEVSRQPQPDPVAQVLSSGAVPRRGNHTLLLTRDGRELPIDDSAAPIRDLQERILGVVLVFQDVTARRESERSLRMFQKLFKHTSEGIIVTDPVGVIQDVNHAFCRITGYSRDEVLGRTPAVMKSNRHDAEFYQAMWRRLLASGEWQGEVWDRRKSGEIYPKWLSINAVRNSHGETTHYVGIFSDITTIKRTEERLHQLAHYDTLTALPNRMLFQDRLEQTLLGAERHDRGFAVMFIDLDRFKMINDTLGHRAGDALLVEVARRLSSTVRESDTVARLGGDEFTVILPELVERSHASQVAQKIIEAFALPFTIQGQELFTSPSIGIALYPEAGLSAEALTKAADSAMYQAKARGRNNFQFYRPDASDLAHAQLALEHDLRQALARGELILHYQPEIAIDSGAVTGVEALLRWRHPQRGEVAPAEFIPIAEESGLINAIGAWVLETACREAASWESKGCAPLRVSVNISAQQVQQGDFIATVSQALTRSGLPPERLELELTESQIMRSREECRERFDALRAMGVQLSVDDFGTGYSSLAYLKRLPITSLKIDHTFIRDLYVNHDDAAISRAIIAMAKTLNLRVVAEGVESEAQMAFLRQEQCTNAQGFYFSPPVSAEELPGVLQGWQRRRAGEPG